MKVQPIIPKSEMEKNLKEIVDTLNITIPTICETVAFRVNSMKIDENDFLDTFEQLEMLQTVVNHVISNLQHKFASNVEARKEVEMKL